MQKTVTVKMNVCDVCERENVNLKGCILCGRDFCSLTCDGYFPDAVVAVPICKPCAQANPEIEPVVRHYGRLITTTFVERDTQLKLRFRERSRKFKAVGAG